MAAGATGYSGFALKREESDPLVPQADHLLATYLPTMGPNGPLYMFSFSIIYLAGTKYMGYVGWKNDALKKAREEAATKARTNAQ